MQEIVGDIWKLYESGGWLIVEVSQEMSPIGESIIGNDFSLELCKRFPKIYEEVNKKNKGRCFAMMNSRVVTLPIKERYDDSVDLEIVRRSGKDLLEMQGQIAKKILNSPNFYAMKTDAIRLLGGVLNDGFSIVGDEKCEQKEEIVSPIFENVTGDIIAAFKCPKCDRLIEVKEYSGEYFSLYGVIALGEIGEGLKSEQTTDKYRRPVPMRICTKCFPQILVAISERENKNEVK